MTIVAQDSPSAQASRPRSRFNMYQSVHKGLRAFMADTLSKVGCTDYTDVAERQDTASQLRSLLDICCQHLAHENHFLHTAMERRSPGSAARCADEHVAHVADITRLRVGLDDALSASESDQEWTWQQLYQALSLFVAENYEHMLMEERVHNAVLWQHYSDEELIEIHDALLATIPADEMAIHFRWMLPQLSHPERVAMLSGMRLGMPAELFASQLNTVEALLDTRSWRKLQAALQVGGASHGQHEPR